MDERVKLHYTALIVDMTERTLICPTHVARI